MSDPVFRLENIRHQYGDRVVLNISHMEIVPGEILALVGPSGAGKSTLLRLLALLETPTQGAIRFHSDGKIVTIDSAGLDDRRRIGMLFQRPVLLTRSVRENVAYGLHLRGEKAPEKVERVLSEVGLSQLASAQAGALSGGELQRAALARLLVLQPDAILLDEPTANLDPANVQLIEQLVCAHSRKHGTTIVLVTHNIFQARRLATRTALLMDGELVEIAPTDMFFTTPSDSRTAAFTSGAFAY